MDALLSKRGVPDRGGNCTALLSQELFFIVGLKNENWQASCGKLLLCRKSFLILVNEFVLVDNELHVH